MSENKIKKAQEEIWDMVRFILCANYGKVYDVFGLFGETQNADAEISLTGNDIQNMVFKYSYDWFLGKYRKYKESLELHRGDVVVDKENGSQCVIFGKSPNFDNDTYISVYKNGKCGLVRRDEVDKTGKTVDLSMFDELEEENE